MPRTPLTEKPMPADIYAEARRAPSLRYMLVAAFNEYIRRHGAASSVHDAACSAEMMDLLEAAVRDAARAVLAMEWRDIATAPRDGTEFLAEMFGIIYQVVHYDNERAGEAVWWVTGANIAYRDGALTHWLPLPEAPTPPSQEPDTQEGAT